MLKKLGISLLLIVSSVFAQTSDRLVDSIVVTNLGTQTALADQAVLSHIELKAGEAFSQTALDRSVKALYATDFFEDIKAIPENTPNGRIKVEFKLTPKMQIRTISFEGNREFKDKRLLKKIDLSPNDRVDAQRIASDARKLEQYYETKKFPNAKVVTRTVNLEQAGLVDLTFVIDEGREAEIDEILFEGNANISSDELRKAIRTKKEKWHSWLTSAGRLEEEKLVDDVEIITEIYRNRGYLEAVVYEPVATKAEDKGEVILTFKIEEGALYKVGAVKILGNKIYDVNRLSEAVRIRTGMAASADAIDASVSGIRNIYGVQGYLNTRVSSQMTPSSAPRTLDITFNVEEAPRVTVGSINVEGNTLTKAVVVAREINLAPGDVFSSHKKEVSQQRLKNTGYFEEVNLTNEPTEDPNVQDLRVELQEGKTGNVIFGAGVSSLDSATVFTEFTQSNFDISNWKNFFRGDGQKFRLYLSLSEESNEASVNWEEPWLFEKRLAFGTNIYRTETDYVSSKFDERRAGAEIYLRKRLFELVNGRIGYRRENVTIFDIDSAASSAIQNEEGTRGVSKLAFSLTRDTRDRVMFPTRGNRAELNFEYAGGLLGSETDYWSIEARGAHYRKVSDYIFPQYLTVLGRAGIMDSFDGNEVPLFDRFFLGGPNSLRGYSYRKVGPKDGTDEPLGGKTYGFGSLEYSFQVAEPFYLATFYDWGFVNTDSADFSTSNYNDNWGVGARFIVMGAPLRLDLAMPITSDAQNDNDGRFWFSFGSRF